MLDLKMPADKAAEIVPARKLTARVAGLYAALKGAFQTEPVEELVLGFDGIERDFHAGQTRRSGGRKTAGPGHRVRNHWRQCRH